MVLMTTSQLFTSESLLDDARAALHRGEKSQAESLFSKAIDERSKAVGSGDASVGEFTHELGHCYLVNGKEKEAEETLKKSVEIVEKAYYAGHARLAFILEDIADLYLRQERITDVEPVLVRLLDICDKTMSGDHRMVFTAMHRLSYVYRKLNKQADAEKLLVKALKTIDTPLGPAEEFRFDLALTCQEMDKNAEAETNFKQAISGFEQRKNLPRLADALTAYGAFLKKQGRNDQAMNADKVAKDVRAVAGVDKPKDIFPSTLLRA